MKAFSVFLCILLLLSATGCGTPRLTLFSDSTTPLQEFTVEGEGNDKILLIPITGIISDQPDKRSFRSYPSMVQEIVSHLDKAKKDKAIKAVILKVDTPGGSVTASDILYHEIMAYKKETQAKVVSAMMDYATSGGYYISLPSDMIIAHPTTITGSVGVIYMRPMVKELFDKVGVSMLVNKSGENKDMMSPFRTPSATESAAIQKLIDDLGLRFIDLLSTHRKIKPEMIDEVSTAKVYLAEKAKKIGLIDKIGYLSDAVEETRKLAGIEKTARLVTYRRSQFSNDNIYNNMTTQAGNAQISIMGEPFSHLIPQISSGFYYIWPPAIQE